MNLTQPTWAGKVMNYLNDGEDSDYKPTVNAAEAFRRGWKLPVSQLSSGAPGASYTPPAAPWVIAERKPKPAPVPATRTRVHSRRQVERNVPLVEAMARIITAISDEPGIRRYSLLVKTRLTADQGRNAITALRAQGDIRWTSRCGYFLARKPPPLPSDFVEIAGIIRSLDGRASTNQIAAHLKIKPSTAAKRLTKLAALKFLAREPAPGGRKFWAVAYGQ